MSEVCGVPSGRTAGALDEQKAPKPIDRAALEYALLVATKEWVSSSTVEVICKAARAHLATLPEPPKTKMVEVWRVEWAVLAINRWVAHHRGEPTREEANHCLARLIETDTYGNTLRCARVTGPHFQEVPA